MGNIVTLASDAAVQTDRLTTSFGSTRALSGLSLSVAAGQVYGLLGPNGAGKTTLVRILATLLRPDSGTARVFGHDVVHERAAVRSKIALTAQFACVDTDLTGRENLIVLGRLLGLRRPHAAARADELLSAFALQDAGGRLVKTYSGGMSRRLDIAAGVIVRPDLVFLDEPTTGLDPRSRNQVWQIIRGLSSEGTTVLLTTQYLEEADRLADAIAVIDHGTLIAEGTSAELKASLGRRMVRIHLDDLGEQTRAQQAVSAALGVAADIMPEAPGLSVPLATTGSAGRDAEQVAAVLAALGSAGIAVRDIGIEQPSLDEVFLALTDTNHQSETLTGAHSS